MIDINHEKDLISLLETLKDTTESVGYEVDDRFIVLFHFYIKKAFSSVFFNHRYIIISHM